jgi:hypothetical protein
VAYARKLSAHKLSRTGKDMDGISRVLIEVLPTTFPERRKKSTLNLRILRITAEIGKELLPNRSLHLYPDIKHYGNFLGT